MKKIIYIIFITLLLTCGCSKKQTNTFKDSIRVSTSENIIKNQTIDNIFISNVSLIYEDKSSTFTCDITNNSDNAQYIKEIKIHIKTKKGRDIIVLSGYVDKTILPSETYSIASSYTLDLTKAYSVEYEIVR